MAPNMDLPPIAWRQGDGYVHPDELPPPPPPTASPVFLQPFFIPQFLQAGVWGPAPPIGQSGFAVPPPMFPFAPNGYWGPSSSSPSSSPPEPYPPKKDAPKDSSKKKDNTPNEYKLPGGHLPGSVFHYQDGKTVTFHVLGTTTGNLDDILRGTHDGYISKQIHRFNENVSVEHVMQKLRAGEGGKMTQVFEKGAGEFTRGTTWEVGGGGDKGKKVLREYGWGGAGVDRDVEPIWVVVQKK